MWQIAEVLPAILPYLIFWLVRVEFGENGLLPTWRQTRGTDVRAVGRPETKRNHNQKGIPASGTGDPRFICSFGLTLGSDKDEKSEPRAQRFSHSWPQVNRARIALQTILASYVFLASLSAIRKLSPTSVA
jgi:hypothetical protein